ncbi:MAG: flavin reductase family protein [Gemmatimonadetes bacterium]|nr:flavin reductase family protein [Gemmatimonadota bacterium]
MNDQREDGAAAELIRLGVDHRVWDRFFQVSPLVVVGTKELDGSFDLAPKHMVTPLGWDNFFGFVCTPAHGTYVNARREGAFTVSFPRPSQVLSASLAAAPRCGEDEKPSLALLATRPATVVEGVLLKDAYLHFECRTEKIVDGFGRNSLIAGRIVEALVEEDAIRRSDRDDQELLMEAPLLAYIAPGRYSEVNQTMAFPFHEGSSR